MSLIKQGLAGSVHLRSCVYLALSLQLATTVDITIDDSKSRRDVMRGLNTLSRGSLLIFCFFAGIVLPVLLLEHLLL